MNLLMVDDQESVISGLQRGIDWDAIGIDRVFSAFCASEAKEVLEKEKIDVLLCDIEMPGENGIQLLDWINEKQIVLKCIFLTAHAEFDYAVDAIRKGSVNYILQPAPYDEIRDAVVKAIEDIRSEQEKDYFYRYGKTALQDEDHIKSGLLLEILRGHASEARYMEAAEYVSLPRDGSLCTLMLAQIIRWKINIARWDESSASVALNNIAKECFAKQDLRIMAAETEKYNYSLLVYTDDGSPVQAEKAAECANELIRFLHDYVDGETAVYCSEPCALKQLQEQYAALTARKKNNVSLKPGLFRADVPAAEKGDLSHASYSVNIGRWMHAMEEGYGDSVCTEIENYIDTQCERGAVTRDFLTGFHMAYMSAFIELLNKKNIDRSQVFGEDHSDVYNEATESVDGLKRFVRYTAAFSGEGGSTDEESSKDIVFRIRKYVSDHIERDIRRPELAEYIHLNEDYMTRVFKKETGMALKEYIIEEKLKMAQNMIRTTALPIGFIAARIGYCNYSHFSKIYKKTFGIAPTEERRMMSENDKLKS
ncbi:MAG: response regulator [Lachnospiraceae bacterium]|jgi:two-component system response regulator YesN|nr:response regulator [Lachnospiraceae bacterium]